jgi:L-threonylcarbamoyladenylate synthase
MNDVLAIDRDNPEESALALAADVIKRGELIVYPTETLYGIGADATNPSAIKSVHKAKHRTEQKPILVIVNSIEMMLPYVEHVPLAARILMEKLWPGPLTLVFEASASVSPELVQGTGTIGIRIPSSRLCLRLLSHLGVPLTSTSANIAGEQPVRNVAGIKEKLTGISLYLDVGELPESQPSTIVDVTEAVPRVVRSGAIGSEALEGLLWKIRT